MKLFLLGLMGSGKTFWKNELAAKLKLTAYDLDQLIVAVEEASIPEIFEREGEIYFRKTEANILKPPLQPEDPNHDGTGLLAQPHPQQIVLDRQLHLVLPLQRRLVRVARLSHQSFVLGFWLYQRGADAGTWSLARRRGTMRTPPSPSL